ncbi:hypothetical protein L3X38_021267 [Prunus dulcis]|uniref:Uncharacterized protein n=1 Tax=Prunus dulcis TaxID=3755 RepID=A0AAD4VW83_PRUDU|nr:hypothetical protein L3X38_021267 [Prunus dulcis]
MDNVSSLECLKLDSQSEVLYKDGCGKDLLSPAMVPINCDTPITGSEADELEADESEVDDSDTDDFETNACETDESETDESETDKSETDYSETDDSKTDDSKIEKLISHECGYCLKVGEHFTQLCHYRYHVPENAIVGKRKRKVEPSEMAVSFMHMNRGFDDLS